MDDDNLPLPLAGIRNPTANNTASAKQSANKLNSLFDAEEDWSKGNSASLVYTAKRPQKTNVRLPMRGSTTINLCDVKNCIK